MAVFSPVLTVTEASVSALSITIAVGIVPVSAVSVSVVASGMLCSTEAIVRVAVRTMSPPSVRRVVDASSVTLGFGSSSVRVSATLPISTVPTVAVSGAVFVGR